MLVSLLVTLLIVIIILYLTDLLIGTLGLDVAAAKLVKIVIILILILWVIQRFGFALP